MRYNEKLNQLLNYTPKDKMFTSGEEVEMITETLQLKELSCDDLCNLRDFTVLKWSALMEAFPKKDTEGRMNTMAALQSITAVIDNEKYNRKMEV